MTQGSKGEGEGGGAALKKKKQGQKEEERRAQFLLLHRLQSKSFFVVGRKKIISYDTKNKPFGNFWKGSHLNTYIHIIQCTQDAE
jgi:hypothetical protein